VSLRKSRTEQFDAIVVGSGLTGVIVAEELASHGLSALILEGGPVLDRRLPSCDLQHYQESIQPLLNIDEGLWDYEIEGPPFEWVRIRAGGGRSLLWGG